LSDFFKDGLEEVFWIEIYPVQIQPYKGADTDCTLSGLFLMILSHFITNMHCDKETKKEK